MYYLIQGFFFQNTVMLDPDRDLFINTMVRLGLLRIMFSGVLGPASETNSEIIGVTNDVYGEAELDQMKITDKTLSFRKKYTRKHGLTIHYTFSKQRDGSWSGDWTGPATGSGTARCILVSILESFLMPHEQ